MRRLILFIVGFLLISFSCVQAELNYVFQDVDAPIQHSEYIKDFDSYLSDDEDPEIICNFTLIKQMPSQSKGHLILMGASMGEYVVPTGMDFEMGFCEMFDEPIIMARLLDIFGFQRDNCPPKPGVYGTEGCRLDTSTLPDEFPSNNYLAIFKITDETEGDILVFHLYMRVY